MKRHLKKFWSSAFFLIAGLAVITGFTTQNQQSNQTLTHLYHSRPQQQLAELSLPQVEFKGYTEIELDQKISETIAQIHTFFTNKYDQIKDLYPGSEAREIDKAITYLLYKISANDAASTNSYYSQLFDNLKNIILQNFNSSVFITASSSVSQFVFHTYLANSTLKLGDGKNKFDDFVINTVSDQTIKKAVDDFLTKFSNYLTSTNAVSSPVLTSTINPFALDWYTNIPEALRPVVKFGHSLEESAYSNLIKALTTKDQNSKIVADLVGLKELISDFNTQLISDFENDLKYLSEKITKVTIGQAFSDSSPLELMSLIKLVNSTYDFDWKDYWNLNLSRAEKINLLTNSFPNVKVVDRKINYSTADKTSAAFSYTLNLNNANLNHTNTGLYYSTDFKEAAETILNWVNQTIRNNFFRFYQIDPNINLRNYPIFFDQSSFKETSLMQQLRQILPLSMEILNVNQTHNWDFLNQSRIQQFDQIPFSVSYQLILGDNSGSFNWDNKKVLQTSQLTFEIPNTNQLEALNQAPELIPVWNGEELKLDTDLAHIFDNQNFLNQHFSFNNTNPELEYKILSASREQNNIKLTNQITVVGTNLSRTYTIDLPISTLLSEQEFQSLVDALIGQIENEFAQKFPDEYAIYKDLNNGAIRQSLLEKVLAEIRSNPDFLKNTLEENIELFKSYFQKELENFFNKTEQQKIEDQILDHYAELRHKLITALNRLGISLESQLAKILLGQIDAEQALSLQNKKIAEPSAELKAIIDFVNDPDSDIDKIQQFAPILEKLNPYLLSKTLDRTEKGTLYAVTVLTAIMAAVSTGFIWRISRIDSSKFRLRKGIFLAIGLIILALSLGGSGFLISLVALG
ncbi:hypothetical protein J2Z62_000530 [Mycoplasmoides fastidiosum]|uniref:Uncharacterized protein n=1 Tax=Mycoplasmoides fastidiosum TaxID=92758 RepID=A0ABU0LZG1_9BACT|nr:hypothetical protein [Mycoplasmoides fastidiosum]MDQ0514092.1 hypothetical protein [Mycoplasmoides fastidiosum]UUD37499.1 hypothetical protein NPA10_02930 [Mycoplasmoides fastidiosum]